MRNLAKKQGRSIGKLELPCHVEGKVELEITDEEVADSIKKDEEGKSTRHR